MESKQPGLYFIGEVVDVTGWLGGYNFQWAWASAHACAQALAARQPQRLTLMQALLANPGLPERPETGYNPAC